MPIHCKQNNDASAHDGLAVAVRHEIRCLFHRTNAVLAAAFSEAVLPHALVARRLSCIRVLTLGVEGIRLARLLVA